MEPKIILPPPHLKNYVRNFWILESDVAQNQPRHFRTMADGCPGLMFQHPDYGQFFHGGAILPQGFVFGQSTAHNELVLHGNFKTIGVTFEPHALSSVFGIKAEELTNSCVDVLLLPKKTNFILPEQLVQASEESQKINILSDYIFHQICQNKSRENHPMAFALAQIIGSAGCISLPDLQQKLHLSERSLERQFKAFIGISPKLFSRICRFQSSLKQLEQQDFEKLSDIAFGQQYADQSHFIRSFRQFSGFSPFEFQKKTTAIVENFSEISP